MGEDSLRRQDDVFDVLAVRKLTVTFAASSQTLERFRNGEAAAKAFLAVVGAQIRNDASRIYFRERRPVGSPHRSVVPRRAPLGPIRIPPLPHRAIELRRRRFDDFEI